MRVLLDFQASKQTYPRPICLGDAAYYSNINSYKVIPNLTNNAYPYPKNCQPTDAEYFTKKFNNYQMYTWVVTVDPFSYRPNNNSVNQITLIKLFGTFFIQQHIIDQEYDILCVFQEAPTKGLHLHFNILTTKVMNQDAIDGLTNIFSQKFDFVEARMENDPIVTKCTFIAKYEKIKSTGSYINYLQSSHKGTFYTIGSSKEIIDMFCSFDKNIIFPTGTTAKRSRYVNPTTQILSDNNLVIFLMQKLHSGVADYNTLLQDPNIQAYLHIHNLKQIWDNCYHQFSASLTHTQNIIYIMNQFAALPSHKICCCSVIDLLIFQGIKPKTFGQDLVKWLFAWQKQNVLYFEGRHNSGKSHFARMLWGFFLLKQRIVNDGMFSFGNAPGSGCLLWEETHIPPELADITKLMMEGEPTVAVTIKNHPSRLLGKRIPMIITNNHPLGIYCTNEQTNFDVRCFKYFFNRQLTPNAFCTNAIHYCPRLDLEYRATKSTQGSASETSTSAFDEASVEDCNKFHKLTDTALLTFIALAISDNYTHILIKCEEPILSTVKLIIDHLHLHLCESSNLNYD